jgi:hypothetical protein
LVHTLYAYRAPATNGVRTIRPSNLYLEYSTTLWCLCWANATHNDVYYRDGMRGIDGALVSGYGTICIYERAPTKTGKKPKFWPIENLPPKNPKEQRAFQHVTVCAHHMYTFGLYSLLSSTFYQFFSYIAFWLEGKTVCLLVCFINRKKGRLTLSFEFHIFLKTVFLI